MSLPYVSALSDISVHQSGFVSLGDGVEITAVPLVDTSTGLYARIGPIPVAALLRTWGMRLPAVHELRKAHKLATYIRPVTLPTAAMCKAAGVDVGNERAVNSYRSNNMRSREWCEIHDAAVREQLSDIGWCGELVMNVGKHWAQDKWLFGWRRENGTFIQEPGGRSHLGVYTDYGSLVHATRDVDAKPDSRGAPPFITNRGDRNGMVVQMQQWLMAHGYRLPRYGADGQHGNETQMALDAYLADVSQDTEPAPPSLAIPFRQARHYTKGRGGHRLEGITIHVAQIGEVATAAESLAYYCAAMADDRKASWHYSVDSDSIIQSVRDCDTAWAAGPGNGPHLHIELAGYVDQGSVGWHDDYSQRMLRLAAQLVASKCREHAMPVRMLTAGQLLDGDLAGICGHDDWSLASSIAHSEGKATWPWYYDGRWHMTTHQDPGPSFPWDEFMAMVSG